jgi:tRNA pseudouridine55 synthase
MTAHDVVARARKIIGVKQIGHAGTLDPMATGVLPLAIGKACRLLRFLDGQKTYLAEILLGRTTDTDDIEGSILETSSVLPPAPEVERALEQFRGTIEQTPPAYSAVHHQGKRLYELARSGNLPEEIPSRSVTIHDLQLLDIALPVVRVRITCAAGTYIRSIARDLGKSLGCGGCLQSLIREQAGPFRIDEAFTLEQLQAYAKQRCWDNLLRPAHHCINLPAVDVDRDQARALNQGKGLSVENTSDSGAHVMAIHEGKLIAICRTSDHARIEPEVVIANAEQVD